MIDDTDPFAAFDDDLSTASLPLRDARPGQERVSAVNGGQGDFVQTCPKCGGSGRFISYTGRDFGPCFACKGAGRKTFKTSPEARAKTADRRAAKAAQRKADNAQWRADHAAEVTWLQRTAARMSARPDNTWTFPAEVLAKLEQYGTLTDGQLIAVRNLMARDEARRAEREAAKPTVDTHKLTEAFQKARQAAARDGEGLAWLNLRLASDDGRLFRFSDAPARGEYKAAIFVNEGQDKLGRICDGRFSKSHICDDVTEKAILEVCSDPAKAALAYGQRTGNCSVCGRTLTNAESRQLGIGPICRERFGL